MGDRANIVLRQRDQHIYLYSHWGGSELPETLRQGLIRGQSRWDDETYLGRILFAEMTKGDENGTTGYGIGVYPSDNEYAYLVVNAKDGTVTVHAGLPTEGVDPIKSFSFAEYCERNRTWANVT